MTVRICWGRVSGRERFWGRFFNVKKSSFREVCHLPNGAPEGEGKEEPLGRQELGVKSSFLGGDGRGRRMERSLRLLGEGRTHQWGGWAWPWRAPQRGNEGAGRWGDGVRLGVHLPRPPGGRGSPQKPAAPPCAPCILIPVRACVSPNGKWDGKVAPE